MDALLENGCIGQTNDEIYVSAGSPLNTIDALWLLPGVELVMVS